MSGWTTITIELRGEEEYFHANDKGHVGDEAQDEIHSLVDDNVQVFSGISHAGNHTDNGDPISYLVAVLGGYREWDDDVSVLEQLREFSNGRAVVIQVTDTGDIGEGRLYEQNPADEWEVMDVYDESIEGDGSGHWGMKAAAVMYAKHDIPAVAKTRPLWDHSERDDYTTDAPGLNSPR